MEAKQKILVITADSGIKHIPFLSCYDFFSLIWEIDPSKPANNQNLASSNKNLRIPVLVDTRLWTELKKNPNTIAS